MFTQLPLRTKARWLTKNQASGFTIVEVILASALFALITTGLAGTLLYGEEAVVIAGQRGAAVALADESMVAVRNMRDADYALLVDGVHGLAVSNNQWVFSGVSDTVGVYARQLTITSLDLNRKKVVATVAWQENIRRSGQINLTTYLTNWRRVVVPPPPPGP
ncbi:MAG: hypothetical protein EXS55_01030 [Candidatus Magasanikbacteria bacterium]|nr:hypothetical protein [Candidatus Magasanikbacteria bacterium]